MSAFLNRWRAVILNLLFAGYLLTAQPVMLQRMTAHLDTGRPDFWLGVAFLALPLLELLGLYFKAPAILARLEQTVPISVTEGAVLPLAAGLAHMMLHTFLLFTGLHALGLDIPEQAEDPASLLWMGLMAALVIKELFLLAYVASLFQERRAWFASSLALPGSPPEWLGDLLLLASAAFGFTALWDFAATRTPFHWSNPLLALVDLVGFALFFAIALLAAWGVPLCTEWYTARTRASRWLLLATTAINFSVALSLLPAV